MRVAVVGGGVSGITAATALVRAGHKAVIFERSASLGGVWAVVYPEVRLQNTAEQYRLSDFPWPFKPDLHPTREQILRYYQAVVDHYHLDLRLQHEVVALQERTDGWLVEYRNKQGSGSEPFDFVIVAPGQYTGEQHRLNLAGRERFPGQVITDREVHELTMLDRKRVAVVGFGKSAVDMATFAAERGARVDHVFRAPRWLVPQYILGLHMSKLLFARMSTAFIPCWVQPTDAERFLQTRLRPLVNGFWSMIGAIVRLQCGLHSFHRDPETRRRMKLLRPEHTLPFEMRSGTAVAPKQYFSLVAKGTIEPHRGEVAGCCESGLKLVDGREISAELIILSTGFQSPRFPYLPAAYREMLERESDGVQLYRHLIHPRIPRLAFAGFNHGFLHVPTVEVAMLWLSAHLRGDLTLPPVDEMERRIEEVRTWKREHILFEPSRGCGVSTRFQQYLDVLLADLGLNPHRKSNPLAEQLIDYSAQDYAGILDEYERSRTTLKLPRQPLPLST